MMKVIPPIPIYLDHLGTAKDVFHVMSRLEYYRGVIDPGTGELFSPKVTPDLRYLAHFTFN